MRLLCALVLILAPALANALFDLTGVSLNVMSLGGLALAVGMLVDNSIVVLENIFRHREAGRGTDESAVEGTAEVGAAITASTLTTIAVFGPVLYVQGVAGTLFEELSLSVAFALLASLLAARARRAFLEFVPIRRGPADPAGRRLPAIHHSSSTLGSTAR